MWPGMGWWDPRTRHNVKKLPGVTRICRISTVAVPFVKTVEPQRGLFHVMHGPAGVHRTHPFDSAVSEQTSHQGLAEGPYSAPAERTRTARTAPRRQARTNPYPVTTIDAPPRRGSPPPQKPPAASRSTAWTPPKNRLRSRKRPIARPDDSSAEVSIPGSA